MEGFREDKEKIIEELEKVIDKAIEKIKDKKVALLFSGGIDSTTIAYFLKKHNVDFICYTIGFEGSEDIKYAKEVAEEMDLPLKVGTLDYNQLEDLIKELIKVGITNPMHIAIAVPSYVAGLLAKDDGREILISGLGSDELLAGYGSHKKALEEGGYEAVHQECIRRIEEIYPDFHRDELVAKSAGLTIYYPFLDKDFIKLAISISPELKISKDSEKIILRELGKKLSLPEKAVMRKKRAAQYGSGAQKAIEKLAKEKGFNTISEYIEYLKSHI